MAWTTEEVNGYALAVLAGSTEPVTTRAVLGEAPVSTARLRAALHRLVRAGYAGREQAGKRRWFVTPWGRSAWERLHRVYAAANAVPSLSLRPEQTPAQIAARERNWTLLQVTGAHGALRSATHRLHGKERLYAERVVRALEDLDDVMRGKEPRNAGKAPVVSGAMECSGANAQQFDPEERYNKAHLRVRAAKEALHQHFAVCEAGCRVSGQEHHSFGVVDLYDIRCEEGTRLAEAATEAALENRDAWHARRGTHRVTREQTP